MPTNPPDTGGTLRGFVLDACLAASLVLALHGEALLSLFSYDDTILLSHTIRHGPFRYLFVPEAWQSFNWRGFYPLYLVSFDLQLRAFGLSPLPFHAYQLALACAAALLLRSLVRLAGGGPWVARSALVVFLVGPVVGTLARQLMTRCFLEGGVLLLGAACALVAGDARRSRPLLWAAAALWLASGLEKEVFVPLVVPLALFAARRGPRLAVPFAAAAACYAGYRLSMAPYGVRVYDVEALSQDRLLAHAASLLRGLGDALLPGHGAAAGAVLLVLVLLAAAWTPRDLGAWALVAVTAAATLGPVLLVSEVLSGRHLFHAWIALVLWLAVGLERWADRGRSKPALAAAVVAASALAALLSRGSVAHAAGLRAESAWYDEVFLLAFRSAASRDVLVSDTVSVHYPFVPGVNALRLAHGDGREVPYLVTDEAALCRTPFPPGTLFWDVRGRRIRLRRDLPDLVARDVCPRVRPDGRMRVSLVKTGGLLEWDLGPPGAGTWSLVFVEPDKDVGGPAIRYDVPARGGAWIPEESRSTRLYVQHTAADGGIVQSPDFTVGLRGDSRVGWER